jgi:hypothetical protein
LIDTLPQGFTETWSVPGPVPTSSAEAVLGVLVVRGVLVLAADRPDFVADAAGSCEETGRLVAVGEAVSTVATATGVVVPTLLALAEGVATVEGASEKKRIQVAPRPEPRTSAAAIAKNTARELVDGAGAGCASRMLAMRVTLGALCVSELPCGSGGNEMGRETLCGPLPKVCGPLPCVRGLLGLLGLA